MLLLALLACAAEPVPEVPPPAAPLEPPPAPAPPPPWPDAGAPLVAVDVVAPEGFGVHRVAIDPGHGAPGNPGNSSAYCKAEQDHTVDVAGVLTAELTAAGFSVHQTRSGTALPTYGARIAAMQRFGAEAMVSIHSDVRGEGTTWTPEGDAVCSRSDGELGFAVLHSDEGGATLAAGRVALARAIAGRLAEAGFPAYDGGEYEGLYEGDPAHLGVFVDRHAPRKRIRMLRQPAMPSVIVETHHAWHPAEADRWEEERTKLIFAAAVRAALTDFLGAG